ncbi:MAG: long-chain fatty acid--CoA ligase [Chloroherpetonaceae bacterium]|nr:long-chain fatty acid--CoA ligase [Chloroherpetonaceae bacterium]
MALVNNTFKTLPEMFAGVFSHFAGRTEKFAYCRKVNGRYQGVTHDELKSEVHQFAAYLSSVGVEKSDRIAILSENRLEWVIADMATLMLGAIDVPIYPSLPPNQISYILNNADVKVVICSNSLQLNKIRKIRSEVPSLKVVISFNDLEQSDETVTEFSSAKKEGKKYANSHPNYLSGIQIFPDDLATLVYTSGTTGNPKGVMLTHRNICENVRSCDDSMCRPLNIGQEDIALSFLPLSHTYERTAGYYLMFGVGATIYYAESIETVSLNMTEAKPTFVITVPRLFERIKSQIFKGVDSGPESRRKIFYWALNVGQMYAKARRKQEISTLLKVQFAIADKLVFSKLRDRFGGQIRYFISGGAALPKETGELFEALGIIILEGFGLTETSPVTHVNRPANIKFGTVGPPIKNVEHQIAKDGEILLRGPNIMKGYWRDDQATKEVINEDGWFHTGDIGEIDTDNYLKITDRKKHIIVNSGGKNIAPLPIENLLGANPFVEQVVVIGEKRPFLSAVIVPNYDMLKSYFKQKGLEIDDHEEILKLDSTKKIYEDLIRKISRELASHEKVRRFILAPEAFSIDKGEMTPTLKVKRKVVEEKFKNEIEETYRSLAYEAD